MAHDFRVNTLIQKIRRFLVSNLGKVAEDATIQEFYQALVISLREEIMINWLATKKMMEAKQARIINYLSMEYLPGKHMGSNITNIGSYDLIQNVLQKMNRSYIDLLDCEPDPGLGNGGLGRLASCFLDSLATQHYPCYAYGLRYQYGIFEQQIWNGIQVEKPDCWLLNLDPWEFRNDSYAENVHFDGKAIHAINSHGEDAFLLEDFEEVRALPFDTPIIGYATDEKFSVLTLRLWSTKESPRNFELQRYNSGELGQAGENTSLTDVLYPNDNHEIGKRIRLKQEFLLTSASLQDIIKRHMHIYDDITSFGDKARIQINDTHPALMIAELMRRLIKNYDMPWDQAWEITQQSCSYTNHTIMQESLEEWNEQRMQDMLPRQFRIIQKINATLCKKVRKAFPSDEARVKRMSIIEQGQVRMAHLCLYGCHKVNGVAKLHTKILKEVLFRDFNELFPDKLCAITNGVTPRRWVVHCNPLLTEFLKEKIGQDWITDFTKIKNLSEHASDRATQEAFLNLKKENKKRLLSFLAQWNPLRDHRGMLIGHSNVLDENALIDVQIKRIHEYKRPLLNALHLLMLYHELKDDPNSHQISRMVLFAGKAAPGYQRAKDIICLIYAIAEKINNDPDVNTKLCAAFIENYNVSKAEIIIPAADLSQQISMAGMEASGTGNMKLSMNGALTLGTEDGANIEMRQSVGDEWWPFPFGSTIEEIVEMQKNQSYDPKQTVEEHPDIQRALGALRDQSIARNETEHLTFTSIYQSLLETTPQEIADRYFVLKDLRDYHHVQKKVEELFLDPYQWAEFALHNIAGMGDFSTDGAIRSYAEQIWESETCPPSNEMLNEVREEYSESDRCRISR